MSDTEIALHLRLIRHLGERRDATDATQAVQTVADYREARGVVTAVLEFAQAFEQDGNNVTAGDRPYYSTHKF
jgi:hypothetical protein